MKPPTGTEDFFEYEQASADTLRAAGKLEQEQRFQEAPEKQQTTTPETKP
jgi:hypothetical protein